ncbi:mechanosensitive ion channel domain-containing protein [Paraburkholderia caffeinilytica]|uniref:mechanosensitive ion channel domain-containing protein n=1 Tax=Paraburkholderia caffeinilytica TaxID=1761016 RepID=UPI0038B7D8B4
MLAATTSTSKKAKVMDHPLLAGYALVAVDLLLWRFRFPLNENGRLFARLFVFALLSALLFSTGLNPLSQPGFAQSTALRIAGQILEVIWWLTGARLLSLALDSLLLPKTWRKQRLFQDVFGAVVFLAAIVAALAFVFELPIRGVVATSGALAIVLGLAIQSTLSDVFAGIVINTTEPYQIGDWVAIDGVEGKVLEMNWRATHLLTGHGNVVIVPNAVAAKTKITNNNRPPALHGVSVVLEISPEERPGTVIAALENALAAICSILRTPAPYAQVKKTDVNSIQYEVTAYVDDMGRKLAVSNELYDLCYRHLAAAGIDLRPLSVAGPVRESLDPRERLLRRIDLFAALESDDVKRLAAHLTRQEFDVGQMLMDEDTVPDSLSIVDSGVLSATMEEQGGQVEVGRLGPGDSVGEAGLLAGLPAKVRITALRRSVVYQLKKDDLTPILKNNPEVAKRMCRLLSSRQETLGKLSTSVLPAAAPEQSVFQWLLEKVRTLHSLT